MSTVYPTRVNVECADIGLASVVSAGLGCGIGVGAISAGWGLLNGSLAATGAGLFAVGTCVFHLGEYACIAYYRPRELRVTAFLMPGLGAQREYNIAMSAAVVEFLLGVFFGRTNRMWVSLFGAVVMMMGAFVRIIGQKHCGANFSHIIETDKRQEHHLVDTGIYAYVRHPAYCGWFYWSVGTQIVLQNPVCTAGFALVAYMFFKSRIPYEEALLSSPEYFGERYLDYRRRVWCGVPFIPDFQQGGVISDDEHEE